MKEFSQCLEVEELFKENGRTEKVKGKMKKIKSYRKMMRERYFGNIPEFWEIAKIESPQLKFHLLNILFTS